MTRNYDRKLSASIYHHAKNVGIIGILRDSVTLGLWDSFIYCFLSTFYECYHYKDAKIS